MTQASDFLRITAKFAAGMEIFNAGALALSGKYFQAAANAVIGLAVWRVAQDSSTLKQQESSGQMEPMPMPPQPNIGYAQPPMSNQHNLPYDAPMPQPRMEEKRADYYQSRETNRRMAAIENSPEGSSLG